jgi:hypothetical protein
MRYKLILFLFAFLMISYVSAIELNLTHSDSSVAQISSLKYEPYPVNPGEYFDIWISVKFLRNPRTETQFELTPTYPFSLDPNESAIKTYSAGSVSSSILLKYRVRVDDNAVEGTSKLIMIYKFEGTYYTQEFEIDIANAQTGFDAVIQDSTSSGVSIAIANTGKNTANSVIVKIPEQENFMVTGTDGQMIGNLESGDYSIVSFEVSKKTSQPQDKESGTDSQKMPAQQTSNNLSFDIYYTDNIGVRRVVNMELPVYIQNSNSSMVIGGFNSRRGGSSFPWALVIVLLILLITFIILYKKFPEKTRKLLGKLNPKRLFKTKENKKSEIPDWVKKEKEKEKK